MSKSGIGKFFAGALLGFGVGILFASKPGKETRKEIKDKFHELEEKFKNIDFSDLKEGALEKLEDIKKNIEQLSSEDVINIAKDKVDLVKEKLSDMTSYVKKKSVPIIRDAVNNLLDKLDEAQSNVEN